MTANNKYVRPGIEVIKFDILTINFGMGMIYAAHNITEKANLR
ncbi:MAG: hypothetical protein NVS2B14_07600 [Chamaesiphon sp.]